MGVFLVRQFTILLNSVFFQCESLGDVLYQVNWYNLEKELQKDIMLVILRARKPIFVKAGPFGNMTYAMMVAVR